MSNKHDISIIILNYNAEKVLFDCLKSIQEQTGLSIQTIVVDNKSKDNSVSMIKTSYPGVILHERDSSMGFSAGNNAGIPYIESDLVLFLNPDTKFLHPTDLKACVDKFNTIANIGAFTCRIDLALTNSIDQTCHRGFPTPWASLTHFLGLSKLFPNSKLFNQYYQSYLNYKIEHEVEAVGGMFMLMRKSVGEKLNWWDEDYPLYGEDIDFCYRIHQLGLKNYYWPEVTVMHYKGYSTGMSKQSQQVSTASKSTTKLVKGWSVQAMELFYDKHYRKIYPIYITWLVKLGIKLMYFFRVTLA